MLLEEFFDFQATDDIRLKGHRIGIETILLDYRDGLTPEEIVLRYPSLTLSEVYTTIAFYWHNQAEVDAYLRTAEEHAHRTRAAQALNPPPVVQRLQALSPAERAAILNRQFASEA